MKFLISLGIVLFLISPVSANDSVYAGDGVDVYPLGNNQVQLVTEVITITDLKSLSQVNWEYRWNIDVDMTFKNHDAAINFQMGFPLFERQFFEVKNGVGDINSEIIDPKFRTWVSGKEVQIKRKQGIPNPINKKSFSDTVYTYNISFLKEEMKNIKHSYCVGGWETSIGSWELKYILRTGALWQGVIEDLKIILKIHFDNAHDIIGVQPREKSAVRNGNELIMTWNFKNYKPTSDFKVFGNYKLNNGKSSIDEYIRGISYNHTNSAESRYEKNWIYANYGYPFKNAFVRAQFYYSGSPFKENISFNEDKISAIDKKRIAELSALEESQLKDENKQ